MKNKERFNAYAIRAVLILYGIVLLTMIVLAVSNYPVQWRNEVNHERRRDLEVIAQAISYYDLDHDGALFPIPEQPVMITNQDACSFKCPALGLHLPCFDLQKYLVPNFVAKIPSDPLLTSTTSSGFYMSKQDTTLTLGACNHFFKDPIIHRSEV